MRFEKPWILICVLALLLLLCGCGEAQPDAPASTAESPSTTRAALSPLAGSWVNEGQYSQGRDFVETMTLETDGSARIHLVYQGQDYATLEGRWMARDGQLYVQFQDEDTRDRVYSYVIEGNVLRLTGDGKAVEYLRAADREEAP